MLSALFYQLFNFPHLDRSKSRHGNLGRKLDALVPVAGLDQDESADLLLSLDKGTIGDRGLALLHANDRGTARELKCLRGKALA